MIAPLFRRSTESSAVREARARAAARTPSTHGVDALRAPPRPQDSVLSDLARAWLDELPPPLRPTVLCAQYPRIANRIALCWSDPSLTAQLFDSLFVDTRTGRRGFPPPVREELLLLRDHAARRPPPSVIDGLEVEELEDHRWRPTASPAHEL